MIQIMHEALNWTENHCNETKKKYDTLKGYDSFMDLVDAYVGGAQFIQDELKKVRMKLRDKQMATIETDETEQLTTIRNEELFAAYEDAIRQIDNIIEL